MNILKLICEAEKPIFAVLIDPGKTNVEHWKILLQQGVLPDLFMVGGSTAGRSAVETCVRFLKLHQHRPVVLFPGNEEQICREADAILLLSLISGRNPDMLIGRHIQAADELDQSGLEIIPTGYILVENGAGSSVQTASQTNPLPHEDTQLAIHTALAGQQLGQSLIYLEAGSGSPRPVPPAMIKAVHERLRIPLIVGGGIDSVEKCRQAVEAGANLIVVGNALEKNPALIRNLLMITSDQGLV